MNSIKNQMRDLKKKIGSYHWSTQWEFAEKK
jgi:hypothetical protein